MADAADARRRARRPLDGRLHLPPRPGRDLRPRPRRRRPHRRRSGRCAPSYLPGLADGRRGARSTWRLQKERAGSGALGDIGAHAIDLVRVHHRPAPHERLGHDRHHRRRAPAAGRGQSASSGTASAERGEVTVDDVALFTGRYRLRAGTRSASSRPRASRTGPQERAAHRGVGLARAPSPSTSSDMNELEFYDATLPADRAGLPQDPRHRARAPLPRAVVAGRPHARLRARLLAPGRSTSSRRSPPARSRARRSPTACTCSACWTPSSGAPPREAPGPRPPPEPARHARTITSRTHRKEDRNDATDHPVHRPVGRPARSRRSRASPPSGATTASRSPAGATTSTRGAGTTTTTCRASSTCSSGTA